MSTETVAEKQMGKKPVSRKEMSMFQEIFLEMGQNLLMLMLIRLGIKQLRNCKIIII